MPLDRVEALSQAQSEAEGRQWQRQVWGSAIGLGAEPPKDLQERILPNHRPRDGGRKVSAALPYPVSRALARALGEAMQLGLLSGPVWSEWPAAGDGRPLVRIWDGIALSGGIR